MDSTVNLRLVILLSNPCNGAGEKTGVGTLEGTEGVEAEGVEIEEDDEDEAAVARERRRAVIELGTSSGNISCLI